MRRTTRLAAALLALSLALAPALAEARAGDGGSFGSRGSMTWSAPPSTRTAPGGAQPMQRSLTPNNPSPNYGYGNRGYNGYGSGFGQRSGFMSGLMGGLIGAGIGGLLFGHGFFGGGYGWGGGFGIFHFFGFLLQIFLIVLIVRWLFRLFRGNSPALASGPGFFARNGVGWPGQGMMGGGGGAPAPAQIAISPDDYQAFEQLLQGIQAAWSAQNINALRGMTTPEMLSYFGEQLADQASRGVRNEVTDVRLLSGDLAQAWSEDGRDYATVAMRFSMIDVTRDSTGRIVDGSPNEHTTATELWTFVRSRGGRWILSAIQQAR